MLIKLRDGTWINPVLVKDITVFENSADSFRKIVGVRITTTHDSTYTILFHDGDMEKKLKDAETYRDKLAFKINMACEQTRRGDVSLSLPSPG